mmetsp:Transcript_67718/g.185690  ORF Transcript_67718/g.185690 Transcript_67718/m.185690 type:complete len:264 (-) Transcript_67718:58-849(-)
MYARGRCTEETRRATLQKLVERRAIHRCGPTSRGRVAAVGEVCWFQSPTHESIPFLAAWLGQHFQELVLSAKVLRPGRLQPLSQPAHLVLLPCIPRVLQAVAVVRRRTALTPRPRAIAEAATRARRHAAAVHRASRIGTSIRALLHLPDPLLALSRTHLLDPLLALRRAGLLGDVLRISDRRLGTCVVWVMWCWLLLVVVGIQHQGMLHAAARGVVNRLGAADCGLLWPLAVGRTVCGPSTLGLRFTSLPSGFVGLPVIIIIR